MIKIKELVEKNAGKKENTFVGIYFAGHGGMIDNEQAIVINDENVPTSKFNKTTPKFIYPIESKFKDNLRPYGKRCFGFLVLDCCSSNLTKY